MAPNTEDIEWETGEFQKINIFNKYIFRLDIQ